MINKEKRLKKKIIIIISTILLIILSVNIGACGKQEKERFEAQYLVLFDTVTQIIAYMDSEEEFAKNSESIHDNLEEYHQLFDIYHDYEGINNIKTINENAGIQPVKVDKRIIDMLLYAKEAYTLTDGKMNVAFGSVLKIWHEYRTIGMEEPNNAQLPPVELLQSAAKHTDINDLIIDTEKSTVFLADPDMSLDVGAIAKGYAVEQVAQLAIEKGFTSGLISVGGNVRVIGKKGEDDQLWNVGVQNPDIESDQAYLHVAYITDFSLVTSGNYMRYYTVDGKRYHHIINPETLYPSDYFDSVTIICKDSGQADALSTAVYNMPFEQGLALIESLPDTEALWIYANGEEKYSSHFMEFLQ